MENRICLGWDHEIPIGENTLRGLCDTCYSTLMARIRRGQETESELMIVGKLGPKAPRGRKAALDIAASHKAAEEQMARQRAKHAAKAAEAPTKYRKEKEE
jgi:hypothetical protein